MKFRGWWILRVGGSCLEPKSLVLARLPPSSWEKQNMALGTCEGSRNFSTFKDRCWTRISMTQLNSKGFALSFNCILGPSTLLLKIRSKNNLHVFVDADTYLDPPNVALLRALWSLLVGIWGILKGSWGAGRCCRHVHPLGGETWF